MCTLPSPNELTCRRGSLRYKTLWFGAFLKIISFNLCWIFVSSSAIILWIASVFAIQFSSIPSSIPVIVWSLRSQMSSEIFPASKLIFKKLNPRQAWSNSKFENFMNLFATDFVVNPCEDIDCKFSATDDLRTDKYYYPWDLMGFFVVKCDRFESKKLCSQKITSMIS